MKRAILPVALIATLIVCVTTANAKIRRVGYFGTAISGTDYTDFQTAHDVATAGDTIQLYPGNWSANVSKKLIVEGYGYNWAAPHSNLNLQNISGTQNVTIVLKAGSNNSVFEGLDGLSLRGDATGTTISAITIRRCQGDINFTYNNVYTNFIINQCYLGYVYNNSTGKATNITINNSYVYYYYDYGTNAGVTGQLTNCIIRSINLATSSYILKNNIFLYSYSGGVNSVFQYDMFNSSYVNPVPAGTGNFNITNAAMSATVFVGYDGSETPTGTNSNDGRFALTAGSPAKAKGEGGKDQGIFGGLNPYKLSGIPAIPAFYKLTATSTSTAGNPYTITFSVRGNN